ncbi:MAG TPA: SCO1664 family protein [Micromonosporaceae bacterium]|nr:SCO1664 family protein [Micromonosporaceae bacterium]
MTAPVDVAPLPDEVGLALVRDGTLELEGRLVEASNTTLRAFVSLDGVVRRCVYKPVRGERPLWDFPDGTLAGREVSAYLVSTATGWGIVPPTVLREGPLGVGACQLWIDEPDEVEPVLGFVPAQGVPPGWHSVAAARDESGEAYALAHSDDSRLAHVAVFDAVVNNADRKGGHLVSNVDGRLYGVDHGVCFHTDDKLRTVLWGWAGDPLPADAVEVLTALRADLAGPLGSGLAAHLTAGEVTAVGARIDRLLAARCFPQPDHDWPPLPWPPI